MVIMGESAAATRGRRGATKQVKPRAVTEDLSLCTRFGFLRDYPSLSLSHDGHSTNYFATLALVPSRTLCLMGHQAQSEGEEGVDALGMM